MVALFFILLCDLIVAPFLVIISPKILLPFFIQNENSWKQKRELNTSRLFMFKNR
jgi:hypothetical protein